MYPQFFSIHNGLVLVSRSRATLPSRITSQQLIGIIRLISIQQNKHNSKLIAITYLYQKLMYSTYNILCGMHHSFSVQVWQHCQLVITCFSVWLRGPVEVGLTTGQCYGKARRGLTFLTFTIQLRSRQHYFSKFTNQYIFIQGVYKLYLYDCNG